MHRVEQTIDRSRFLCTVAPASSVEEAQAFIKSMNGEFADATHNCWAYVVGPPGSTDRVGMSDDGEPHGTAGRPMLTVLLHSGLGDVVAVVTRYYGGTKLGTGGLVKAYGGAVGLAVETAGRVPRVDWTYLDIVVSYGSIGALQQIWPGYEVEVLGEVYEEDVRFSVRVPEEKAAALRAAVGNVTRGAGVVRDRNS
jgi:uncharacterized YigZ family protein